MLGQKEIKTKYINPYTDFGFKRLFGVEGNKDLLVDFLNQLLPAKHQIKDLTFKNVENTPDLPEERKAIFDIHCESVTGERFIVEMQKAKIKYFKDRAIFYITFPVREQADKGDWNFKLNPIYYIALLDFEYEKRDEEKKIFPKFRRDIMLLDIEDHEIFFDKLRFTFLQMPAFGKKESELTNHYDKWCYFLQNLETFDNIPEILNEEIFKKAFKTAAIANLSKDEYKKYIESLDAYREIKGVAENAIEEGMNIKAIEFAKKMIKANEPIEKILDYTELSKDTITKLINELKTKP
jgi:predicted transposase/invertase (TIGR01784 family)